MPNVPLEFILVQMFFSCQGMVDVKFGDGRGVRLVIELRSMARRGVRALRPMATHGNVVAGNERSLHSGRDDDEPLAEERFIGRSVSGITRPRLRWVRQMTVSPRS